ncbi:MAG: hypothetical protein KatS3mg119_0302 [Rhodothalassiaceae bacterium]|nr:MAG: hypothetical protein KatS3mg119_0302 [Rhodothalassiaceae bacterium]
MKVEIAIDCTPEELRRFLGLPDVSGLNRRFEEAVEKVAGEAMPGADEVAKWMRAWMGQAGEAQNAMAAWVKMFQAGAKGGDG